MATVGMSWTRGYFREVLFGNYNGNWKSGEHSKDVVPKGREPRNLTQVRACQPHGDDRPVWESLDAEGHQPCRTAAPGLGCPHRTLPPQVSVQRLGAAPARQRGA